MISLPDGYTISTDSSLLNIDVIHGFLAESYWARNMPRTLVERMVRHSLNFGVYYLGKQAGFARVISDYTTFAYVADVFILSEHRGKGLSKALVGTILAHPNLQGLRRWMLVTLDAHGVYESFGFKLVEYPERHMEIHRPAIYERPPDSKEA
ncbi:MAG: GNAT family N-acetyltransferase [Methylacidiphilales bacterium]|nr:GNAT family N-acetyltransferase [Candidatus Methylacidiphilales bacterium]